MITAIIGANYGDEGKGLAVNYFSQNGKTLVVRHNGGAQSGHTVEADGKKFVFHELSSGSFNNADTFWDSTYHPDLYVLKKEYDSFYALTGKAPVIYCCKDTKITIIDDILLNCYKEQGSKSGSCGMGIWECVCRNNAGYGITIEQVKEYDAFTLMRELKDIRENYSLRRLMAHATRYYPRDLISQYAEMLMDDTTLFNFAVEIKRNVELIRIGPDLGTLLDKYENIVFESGQGLLLDGDYDVKHGTPSKTGLYNINACLKKYGKTLDEAVYVTRTYLTRHGRGDFVKEFALDYVDETNQFNEWQEGIRYGKFDSIEALEARIKKDCLNIKPHLLVTHANMMDGMLTKHGFVDIGSLDFEKIYVSDNKTTISSIITK